MINEWKKVVNAIMIFDTFDWGVCSVSLPLCISGLCRQNVIFICDGNAPTESLDGLSLSHKVRTGGG
jgi:hypothetical protein